MNQIETMRQALEEHEVSLDWQAVVQERDALKAEHAFAVRAMTTLQAERAELREDNKRLAAELAAIKAQEPVALIDGNGETVYFPSDVMWHYWIGRNCTPLYIRSNA